MVGAEGQAKADEFQAQQAANAAEYGKVKAAQVGTAMTQNLTAMLGHIQAVRASVGSDPRSPTTAAIMGRQEQVGREDQAIKVGDIEAQSRQDMLQSGMYTQAAGQALLGGELSMGGSLLGGLGGAFKSSGSNFSFFGGGSGG